MPTDIHQVDIEFTLALNNRTGKYFFGLDLINSAKDSIGSIIYWRLPLRRPPTGLFARILGRLAVEEIRLRQAVPWLHHWLPLVRRNRPVVFMDPREVILHRLSTADCVICHDMGPITHADLYHPSVKATYEMAFTKIVAARPSLMFFSRASMDAFIALYGDDFRAMTVIYPPLRTGIVDGPQEAVSEISRPYLLTVGSIGARKNQAGAIEAFRLAGLAARGFSYVLCGGPEPGFEAVAAGADQTAGVVRLGYVSDAQLRWLYRNASGFVLPSLLEGFGLPAAEAVAYGLVPLVSRDGALHEVTGDRAILVDPTDIEDMAKGMSQLALLTEEERNDRLHDLKAAISSDTQANTDGAWIYALQQSISTFNALSANGPVT